ncbi:hypothetical protein Tco_0905950 [Tanacetum coccineum]
MAIGTGHRSNNYSESKMNDHLDNNRRQEQRNKVDMSGKYGTCNAGAESVGVSDCNKIISSFRASKHMSSEGFDDVGLRYVGGRWVWLEIRLYGQVRKERQDYKRQSLHRVIESIKVSYESTYRIIATEFAYWAPNIESMEVNSESNPLERKDAEGS